MTNSKQRRLLGRSAARAQQMQAPNSTETVVREEQSPSGPRTPNPLSAKRLRGQWRKAILKRSGLPTTLVGIATLFFSFFPHLTISEPTVLNPEEFFSKSFTISNDGILPVFSVRCGISPRKIMTDADSGIKGLKDFSVVLQHSSCDAGTMTPGDGYTFSLENLIKLNAANAAEADFAVVVSYIPILPPIRMQKCVHFLLYTDSAGDKHWFRSPGHCALFPWLVSNKIDPRKFVD